jgi:uncharacterized protein (UPF0332 family)
MLDATKNESMEEAYFRSSISRSYYGVFCLARNKKGLQIHEERNVHKRVIDEYKNSVNKSEKKVGHNLDELRRLRNRADYNEDHVNKDRADRALNLAKSVLSHIDQPSSLKDNINAKENE